MAYIQKYRVQLVKDGRYQSDLIDRECPLVDAGKILSSSDVAKIFYPFFALECKEKFVVVMLNARNKIIGINVVSEGSLTASIVHPREVFQPAILTSAASIICLHNHPSGDPMPSQDDLQITRILVDAGKILDIRVLDHIIIGENRFSSLASKGLI